MMSDYRGDRALVCHGDHDPTFWWRLKNAFDDGAMLAPMPGGVTMPNQINWLGACAECADTARNDPTKIRPGKYVQFELKQPHQDAMFVDVVKP